jgi:hypothetical protein
MKNLSILSTQHTALSTIPVTHTAFIMRLMLACLLTAVCSAGVHAQNYHYSANNEYGIIAMQQYKITDDAHFGSDPRVSLSMDCLAANGTGQWTSTSDWGGSVKLSGHTWTFSPDQFTTPTAWDPTNQPAWALLSNLLAKPSERYDDGDYANHPGCQPPGLISGGKLAGTYPTSANNSNVKVVANLNGSVRYVWVEQISSGRQAFVVQGFNTATGSVDATHQINITLDGLPNATQSRQMIKNPINHYLPGGGDVSTLDGSSNSHQVTDETAGGGSNYHQDEFDIAIDKKYLYIIWESGGGIYVKVLNLDNGSTGGDGSTAIAAFPVTTAGQHPTIACDVRRNPSSPEFAIAFISTAAIVTGKVFVGDYYNGSFQHGGIKMLLKSFKDPITSGTTDTYTCAATHARVVCSSITGSSHITGVYVLECDELILYNNLSWSFTNNDWNDVAWYVDGKRPYQAGKPIPSPIPATGNSVVNVFDRPIVALANPYDNQSGTYNQFHCLYQLVISGTNNIAPLFLIRGADNNFGNNPSSNTHDTRVLLNREGTSTIQAAPTSYCAAANQMGIHIHWLSTVSAVQSHYYVRDIRTFDEDIEENTLATNLCIIKDGTGHGGSANPKVLDGLKFTLWTDANYGASSTSASSGLYLEVNTSGGVSDFYRGTPIDPYTAVEYFETNWGSLRFHTNGNYFQIGSSTGSTFYSMPVSNIQQYLGGTSNNEIRISPNSSWKFFGLDPYLDPGYIMANFGGDITVNLNGSSSTALATLDIQPGAYFRKCANITGDYSTINIKHGNSVGVLPDPTGGTNVTADATFVVDNIGSLDHSDVNSAVASGAHEVMFIFGTGSGSGAYTYQSHSTNYTNTGSGVGIIQYNEQTNGGYSPDLVILNGYVNDDVSPTATFTNMRFHAFDPQEGGLEFKNFNIGQFSGDVIHVERTGHLTNVYYDINVSANNFENLISVQVAPFNCILIENFNAYTSINQLRVNNNLFISNANTAFDDHYQAAIHFKNTTGEIENNTITDVLFNTGIYMESNTDLGQLESPTFSFLCSNVSNVDIGILSTDYQGYVKLCTMDGCDNGYISGDNDIVKIVFSTIVNSFYSGIKITPNNTTAEVDMRGVHSASSDGANIGAYNTISNNGLLHNPPVYKFAQVTLQNNNCLVDFGKQTLDPSWWGTEVGLNNIIGSTTCPVLIGIISGTHTIPKIDNNYWGGVNPNSPPSGVFEVSYPTPVAISSSSSLPEPLICQRISAGCEENPDTTQKNHNENNTFSVEHSTAYDTCSQLAAWKSVSPQPGDSAIARQVYDSLKVYVEHCANNDPQICFVFNHINGAVALMAPHDSNRYSIYRDWLISVLDLNKNDPCYYCITMGSIARTFGGRSYFAVENYLRQNHSECWSTQADSVYNAQLLSFYNHGGDSTLPPLDSIGLGFLLKSSVSLPTTAHEFLGLAIGSPNPFNKEITLNFTLNRMAYTTIAIYDELGHLVWGDGRGSSLEAGLHTVHIDGKDLPHGTLYARISTGFGEVKTVKLVHE